jgi:hypothetical protein
VTSINILRNNGAAREGQPHFYMTVFYQKRRLSRLMVFGAFGANGDEDRDGDAHGRLCSEERSAFSKITNYENRRPLKIQTYRMAVFCIKIRVVFCQT